MALYIKIIHMLCLTMFKYVDISALDKYLDKSMGNRDELASKLIKIYTDSTPVRLGEIKDLLIKNEFDEIRKIAHALKSSSKMLGAESVMSLCLAIETSCHGSSINEDKVKTLISDLLDVAPQTIEELKRHPFVTSKSSL